MKFAPAYLFSTIGYSLFSVINFVLLIPLLNVLFKTHGAASSPSTVVPEFTFQVQYFKDLFYHYFYDFLSKEGSFAALKYICIILIIGVFLSNAFRYAGAVLLSIIRADMVKKIRSDFFRHLTNLPLHYFSQSKRGDLISRSSADILQIEMTAVNSMKVLFKEPFLIITYFIFLFNISADLTLYSIIILPIGGIAINRIARSLKRQSAQSQKSLGELTSIHDEAIDGIRVLKTYNVGATPIK